ncbi:MAG TPA: hypothetical protein VL984_18365 [Acidimicrobiales bacterium]|nr:hypothetical protein [Acidimicrobiales bacterium]
MPWCDDCSKFWNPPDMAGGGLCPSCGRSLLSGASVAPPLRVGETGARQMEAPEEVFPSGGDAPGGAVTRADGSQGAAAEPREAESRQEATAGGREPVVVAQAAAPVVAASANVKGAPWHFKLLVVGVTVYMVYRIYWLIEWLPKHV